MLALGGLTVVIIAHRLSTIRAAHAIAVVGGGGVLELGTHAELMAKPGGHYAALASRQLGKVSDEQGADERGGGVGCGGHPAAGQHAPGG